MKRIINNQVFLEESEPYVYQDGGRRNIYAMEAAQHMMAAGGYNQGMAPMYMSGAN